MTGGSVMDWWGEGRGARPLVVRDMSSGARDRTCVWGDLSASLGHSAPLLVREVKRSSKKTILSPKAKPSATRNGRVNTHITPCAPTARPPHL